MKKIKKQKIRKFLIVVTALFLILLAALFFAEGRFKDKNNDIEQIDSVNNKDEEEPSNIEEQNIEEQNIEEQNIEEQNNEEETPAENNTSNEENEENDGIIVSEPYAYDVLVNRKNNLNETYVPDDLVSLDDVPTVLENPEVNQLRKDAYIALKELFAAAKDEEEYVLYARSGYRSYYTQEALYKSYVSNNGQTAADKYSAKPGQSEHQTGLAMDITCEALNYVLDDTFGDTEEGKWVSENAHRFGFIIRYPKGKEDITGYLFEPWHIRYLGQELATKVFESGLTLEEYFEQ